MQYILESDTIDSEKSSSIHEGTHAMSVRSKIEWTDATWNPLRGCVKISPGCKHCYAESFAERFRGVPGHPYEQGFDLRLVPEKLSEPFRWATPKMVFVNSMSDLFQDGVPDDYILIVARVMMMTPWHTFQVLTKRPERMQTLLRTLLGFAAQAHHIWWGVSVEDIRYGVPRIAHLRATPARIRFLLLNPYSKILAQLTSQTYIGLSLEERVVSVHVPYSKPGWNPCAISAPEQECPSFSSNGEVCRRVKQEDC